MQNIVGIDIESCGFGKNHLYVVIIILPKYAISDAIGED